MNLSPAPSVRPMRWIRQRVHLLESQLTPIGFLRKAHRASSRESEDLANAMRASLTMKFLEQADRLEPFRRQTLSTGATLYSKGGPSSKRSLLVAFCGKTNRLMLPLPIVLQHLPALQWDVLLLNDPLQTHYRKGCDGFAGSFTDLVRQVAGLAKGYRRCVSLGTSMGGLPAARFALLAGAERGISIGGRPPNDVLRLGKRDQAASAYDSLCSCLPRRSRPLYFVHAGGCAEDAAAAHLFATLSGGRPFAIAGSNNHNVMKALFDEGVLRPFLQSILNEPAEQLAERCQRPFPEAAPAAA